MRTCQVVTYTENDFLGLKRFCHIIVGADFERRHSVVQLLTSGQYEYGYIGVRSNLTGQGEAIFIRQAKVQENQVDLLLVQNSHHLLTVTGTTRGESGLFQIRGEQGLDEFVVFDNQQAMLDRWNILVLGHATMEVPVS